MRESSANSRGESDREWGEDCRATHGEGRISGLEFALAALEVNGVKRGGHHLDEHLVLRHLGNWHALVESQHIGLAVVAVDPGLHGGRHGGVDGGCGGRL